MERLSTSMLTGFCRIKLSRAAQLRAGLDICVSHLLPFGTIADSTGSDDCNHGASSSSNPPPRVETEGIIKLTPGKKGRLYRELDEH